MLFKFRQEFSKQFDFRMLYRLNRTPFNKLQSIPNTGGVAYHFYKALYIQPNCHG